MSAITSSSLRRGYKRIMSNIYSSFHSRVYTSPPPSFELFFLPLNAGRTLCFLLLASDNPCIYSQQRDRHVPDNSNKNPKTGSLPPKKPEKERHGRGTAKHVTHPPLLLLLSPALFRSTTHRWLLQFSSRAGTGQCGRCENLFQILSSPGAKSFRETRTALSGNGFFPAIPPLELNAIIVWHFIRFPPLRKRIPFCPPVKWMTSRWHLFRFGRQALLWFALSDTETCVVIELARIRDICKNKRVLVFCKVVQLKGQKKVGNLLSYI